MYVYKQWASIVGILASLSHKLSMNMSRSSTNQWNQYYSYNTSNQYSTIAYIDQIALNAGSIRQGIINKGTQIFI